MCLLSTTIVGMRSPHRSGARLQCSTSFRSAVSGKGLRPLHLRFILMVHPCGEPSHSSRVRAFKNVRSFILGCRTRRQRNASGQGSEKGLLGIVRSDLHALLLLFLCCPRTSVFASLITSNPESLRDMAHFTPPPAQSEILLPLGGKRPPFPRTSFCCFLEMLRMSKKRKKQKERAAQRGFASNSK